MTLYIHRFECHDCGVRTHADRIVPCFKCGDEMEIAERQVSEVEYEQ